MAKQRPQPRTTRSKGHPTSSTPAPTSSANRQTSIPASPANTGAARRSTYVEAVALYEQGVQALQRHAYRDAERILASVLARYPDEKELHERVRLYLNVCRRQATPKEPAPHSVQERLYAATLSLNGGQYDEAIGHLRLVRDEDPDNDHALYMLAVAHAQRGEHTEALTHLERAIAVNPENRALARRDPDLEPLREDESFQATLDTPARPAIARPPTRPKSLR